MRLDGPNENEGRLEVRQFYTWVTVCDDGFDDNDAKVFCRMMWKGYANIDAIFIWFPQKDLYIFCRTDISFF